MKKLVGYVEVDSGQVILIDPCYIKDFESGAIIRKDPFPKDPSMSRGYRAACEQTLSEKGAGQVVVETIGGRRFEAAVASSTGQGDGKYPVYVTVLDGLIVKLEILFTEAVRPYEEIAKEAGLRGQEDEEEER